jgi:CBS domain containing-hemolysin-like protein
MISWILCGILLILVIVLVVGDIQYKRLTRKDSEKIRKILTDYRE